MGTIAGTAEAGLGDRGGETDCSYDLETASPEPRFVQSVSPSGRFRFDGEGNLMLTRIKRGLRLLGSEQCWLGLWCAAACDVLRRWKCSPVSCNSWRHGRGDRFIGRWPLEACWERSNFATAHWNEQFGNITVIDSSRP